MNTHLERAITFQCGTDQCVGILHDVAPAPERPGVLIVVGGPQYRVGSHRQFVTLARRLASVGYPVFRFDYRGMGDSEGSARDFRVIGPDIRCALDAFCGETQWLRSVVVFALCDAASAALLYCNGDARIGGLMLANPWVRTPTGLAGVRVKDYYLDRLLHKTFWSKLVRGRFSALRSGKEFVAAVRSFALGNQARVDFIFDMRSGLQEFRGPVLLLLSGRDHTAAEFIELCRKDQEWARLLNRHSVRLEKLDAADHTFSSLAASEWVAHTCERWLGKIPARM